MTDWGAVLPTIAVAPTHSELDEEPGGVALHINGNEHNVSIGLLPSHARTLIAQVQAALDMLERG